MGRKKGLGEAVGQAGNERSSEQGTEKGKRVQAGIKGTGISGMWVVPVVYGIIAGVEGVFAGSIVGLL